MQERNNDDFYAKILNNRRLSESFFDSDESSDEEEADRFKFNKEHTLHVFNAIKDHHKNLKSCHSSYSTRQDKERAEFLKHLELIDLQVQPI